ncbi:MAG: hypothetical protein FJ395_10345 [Verrucomicrobia bacterium]|nr:hypothetical protein [Verrucomicrobiota bacterium]
MNAFLHNIRERIKSRLEGRTRTVYEVSTDDTGVRIKWLTIENTTGEAGFRWDAVTTVRAFKRDYFPVDCICLAFETPNGWFEVNEDMKPFGPFLDAVERYLPGFPPQKDWWRQVMHPAFAPNERELWKREKNPFPA